RDWVIEAFNRDLPFDRFTIEQLAGDLLPPPPSPPYEGWETDRLIATGFHRNTLINQEGGTDQEQFRVEALVDRVDTTGTVWLGLTIGCAQCHQHKYDPISQREFYELFAILNNCDEPTLRVPSPEQTAELARLDAAIAAAEEPLKAHDAEFLKGMPAWEEKLAQHSAAPVEWTQCEPLEFHTEKGAVLAAQGDGSVFVDFSIPPQDTFTVTAATPPRPPLARGGTGGSAAGGGSITAVRLEALTHPSLPEKGPGRADNGNFVLSEFEVLVGPAEGSAAAAASASASFRLTEVARVAGRAGRTGSRSESEGWRRIDFVRAVADHAQEGYGAHDAIDGKDATGWAIGVKRGSPNVDREILFFPKEPFEAGEGARLAFRLHHNHKDPKYLLGRFRLSVSAQPAELLETPATIRAILAKPAAERTDADRDLLVDYYKSTDTSRAPLAAKVAALRKERDGLEAAVPTTMILRERKQPRETHIHIRGDFLRKGARVTGGVPDVLPPLPEGVESPNRLDLARWLVSPDNPLTARVTVNRFWQRLFGLGLVETENDFGTQGTPPSHPELLDWLAAEFMGVESRESRVEGQRSAVSGQRSAVGNQQFDIVVEQSADDDRASGSRPSTLDPRPSWSIKRILRTIATSATYRQSSHVTDELYARDPKNRLLARQTRMRLEAEIIRDAALEAGGLLYPKMHGPGVHPPQPEGIYVLTQVQKPWPVEKGPERYRRGMYIYFWRSSPYPMLPTFDAPEANTACTRRPRSNTPLQALTLANDAAFHEIAQGLAKRILAEGPSYDDGRLRYAFATCLARPPSEAESQRLLSFLHAQREHYAASATEAAAAAPSGVAANIAPAEAAAWTALARILLNLDEFVTRE
ncbi:MAG: DUF1549 and DUF1553 domain-containing protein, partial [Planctomycetes bacterium]|nr:DUF1549 and DUF1553 domain-containing protein [Planctomycetota bacterium]